MHCPILTKCHRANEITRNCNGFPDEKLRTLFSALRICIVPNMVRNAVNRLFVCRNLCSIYPNNKKNLELNLQ